MGIFSSKKVVSTGAAVSRLINEKPNLLKNAILKATFNKLPYVPVIVETLINGYNVDDEAFYKRGESGDYPLGLPSGHTPTEHVREDEVKAIIAAKHSIPEANIDFNTIVFREPDVTELAWYLLQREAVYDDATNTYTGNLPDLDINPTYVAEYVTTRIIEDNTEIPDLPYYYNLPQPETWLQIDLYIFDPADRAATETLVTKTYNLYDTNGNEVRNYDEIDSWISDLYVVQYSLPDGLGGFLNEWTWLYDVTSDFYPELDIYNLNDINSPYYPIVPIRLDKEMVDENHSLLFYRNLAPEADKMLNLIGLDLKSLHEALEDNPDINDVDDAYVVFAIPLGWSHDDGGIANTSKGQDELKYLYLYFDYLLNSIQTVDKIAFEDSLLIGNYFGPRFNAVQVRDSELNTTIYWNYIEFNEVTYAPKGEHNTFYTNGRKKDLVYGMSGRIKTEDDPTNSDFYAKSELHLYYHDDNAQKSYQILVHGLYIHQDVYKDKPVVFTLYDAFIADSDKDGFYLPLNRNIVNQLNLRYQHSITFSGICLVSYALKIDKIKWYKRAAFLNLVRIVIFVIAVVSQNWYLLSLDLAVSQVAYLIIESIVVNFLIQKALSVIFLALVDAIGFEAAAILAVVAVVVAGADLTDMIELGASMPDAITLLQAATQLSNAVSKKIQENILEIAAKLTELKEEALELQEEIDAANETFVNGGVDLYQLIPPMLKAGYPETFYNRTINTPFNHLAIDSIQYYYDNSLSTKLPNT